MFNYRVLFLITISVSLITACTSDDALEEGHGDVKDQKEEAPKKPKKLSAEALEKTISKKPHSSENQASPTETESIEEIFEKDIKQYLELYNDRQYEEAFELLHPLEFDGDSKENRIALIKANLREEADLEIKFEKFLGIEQAVKYDGIYYVKIAYENRAIYTFNDAFMGLKKQLMDSYVSTGDGPVYDIDKKSFYRKNEAFMVAIYENEHTGWRYILFSRSEDICSATIFASDLGESLCE